jgi:DNA-binding response OmpR family regulator
MADILLVEDSQSLVELITRELKGAGYSVRTVADGRDALRMHDRQSADLIILDWMLPGLDGLEVLRKLREKAATPVLMLTARSEEADRVLGLEVGADDYLTKPFSMRELLARVRAILRRAEILQKEIASDRRPADRPVQSGPLRLDPVKREAILDSRELELTPTEFDFLLLLLRNPGRAFNRAYLLNTVWNQQAVSGDRAVDNTVLRLRRKLGGLGERLETVWGVGYRWRG